MCSPLVVLPPSRELKQAKLVASGVEIYLKLSDGICDVFVWKYNNGDKGNKRK
jgi:hypothetical protein